MCELVQNDCIIDYEVFLSGPFDTIGMIFVGEERGEGTQCDDILARNTHVQIYNVHVPYVLV